MGKPSSDETEKPAEERAAHVTVLLQQLGHAEGRQVKMNPLLLTQPCSITVSLVARLRGNSSFPASSTFNSSGWPKQSCKRQFFVCRMACCSLPKDAYWMVSTWT